MDGRSYRQRKLTNLLQTAVLVGGMAALLGALGWLLAGPEGLVWISVAGVMALVLTPQLPPGVLLRLQGARPLPPGAAPRLHAILTELAARARLDRVPALHYLPSPGVNAFTVGSREEAAIIVSDGLLRTLDVRQLAGVLAHETSHVANNDMRVMMLADTVGRLTGVLSLAGQLLLLVSLPIMLLGGSGVPLLSAVLMVAAPSLSALLQLALSRTREYDADLEAARLTGDPEGLASALVQLERRGLTLFERILRPPRTPPANVLLQTHPPIHERIQRLLALTPRDRDPLPHS